MSDNNNNGDDNDNGDDEDDDLPTAILCGVRVWRAGADPPKERDLNLVRGKVVKMMVRMMMMVRMVRMVMLLMLLMMLLTMMMVMMRRRRRIAVVRSKVFKMVLRSPKQAFVLRFKVTLESFCTAIPLILNID